MNRRAVAAVALGWSIVVFAGCHVDEAAEVRLYRDVLDAGLSLGDQVSDTGRPLDVVDSMLLANFLNESLEIEGENYLQAMIDRRRALAAFLPTLTLSPSYTWRENTGEGRNRAFDTSLDVDMAVNPVRDAARLKEAGATIEERRALLLNFQDTLLLDVARTHYEVIRAERAVDVIANSLRVQDERVGDARARLEAGVVRPLDLALAEAQAAQTSADLVVARVNARTIRESLAFATATSMRDRELVDRLVFPDPLPDESTMLGEAWRRRQDLAASFRRIEAAGRAVESAYGQYFPAVSLNLQWFLTRESSPSDLDWTSLIRLSLPLFSAGLIEADVREALSLLRQAKLETRQLERLIERDVRISLDNFRASFERADRIHVEVRAAREALDQAEGLFHAGLATNLERLVAQDRLLSAELDLVNAELDARVFYLDALRVTGLLHRLLGQERPEPALVETENPEDNDAMAR